MTARPTNVSVTAPITPAIERVKALLFQPFDLGRWFVIAFGAWLAGLGRRGFGFNYQARLPGGHTHPEAGPDFHALFEHARSYVMNNLTWIIPLAIALAIFLVALGVVMAWLRARGNFIFLHCVALNRAEVAVPWNKFARQGNSLFLFNLVLGFVWILASMPVLILMVLTLTRIMHQSQPAPRILLALLPLGLMLLSIGMVFFIIGKLTIDFVVPIMFLRGSKCRVAWTEFLRLLAYNLGRVLLYLLFQIVVALAIAFLVLAAVIITCCCAGCLMLIPYLGTVLLLPMHVFRRSYSLGYLAQYGPDFNVFPPPAPLQSPVAAPSQPPGAALPPRGPLDDVW
jgi:hypothetical protein